MKELVVRPEGSSRRCRVSVRAFTSDTDLEGRGSVVIITDLNVRAALGGRFPEAPVIELAPGEASKDLSKVADIYRELLDLGADRGTLLLGVGGGVVCDVTGFVGATYKRGLDFGFAPTTLLAQVDAAIGGKNGVNLDGYKNQVGTIVQPLFVNIDVTTLDTLPAGEFANGWAEAVKTAFIGSRDLFELMEAESERLRGRDRELLERVVMACAEVKVDIVNRDERESGDRVLLNYGHTIGHALETTQGRPHGEAVAIGMMVESELGVSLGITPRKDADRLRRLVEAFGLPTGQALDPRSIAEAVTKDKKSISGRLRLPVVSGPGFATVVEMGLERFGEMLDDLR